MRRLSFREKLKLALPILIALGLLCAGALFCWFNPDMRDAFKQALGIEVHRTVKPVGYYGQAIPVTQDLGDVARIAEDDAAAARYESNIPIVESPLASTLEIDGMLTGELEGGDYDFHDPMVIQDAFGKSPLTALALFTTPEAQRVRCTVKGKTPTADIRYETPAQTAHRVPLIGLYPAAENAVELALLDAEGNVTDTAALTVQTGGLPDRMNGMVEPVVCAGESALRHRLQRRHPLVPGPGDRLLRAVQPLGRALPAPGRLVLHHVRIEAPDGEAVRDGLPGPGLPGLLPALRQPPRRGRKDARWQPDVPDQLHGGAL